MGNFLVHKKDEVENLVYSIIKRKGDIVLFDGNQDPKDHDMQVIDAKSLDSNYIKKNIQLIGKSLENNVPLMVLNVGKKHKKELASIIGFSTSGESIAYCVIPSRDIYNRLNFHILEQFEPVKIDKIMSQEMRFTHNKALEADKPVEIDLSKAPTPKFKPEHVHDFTSKVENMITRLRQGKALTVSVEPNTPPEHAVYAKWVYDPYYPISIAAHGYAPAGTETINGTTFIGIYLDNIHENQVFQWLLVNAGGLYKADMQNNTDSQRGWSIGGIKITGPTPSDLSYISGSPNSVSGETTYSASSSFTVGVAAGTDGASSNFSYTESETVSRSISDWEIAQMTEDAWNFFQQNPYDGESQGFPSGAQSGGHAASLPTISVSSLDYQTQTVWKTRSMRKDTENLKYSFVVYPTYIYFDDTGKSWHATFYYFSGGYPARNATWTVDFSKAIWPK